GRGRGDALVLEQRGDHVAEHGLAVAGVAAEFTAGLLVAHGWFLLRFPTGGRTLPAFDLHAERKPHLSKDLLDLFEGLAPEVFGLEHLALGPLNEVADVVDVGV